MQVAASHRDELSWTDRANMKATYSLKSPGTSTRRPLLQIGTRSTPPKAQPR